MWKSSFDNSILKIVEKTQQIIFLIFNNRIIEKYLNVINICKKNLTKFWFESNFN